MIGDKHPCPNVVVRRSNLGRGAVDKQVRFYMPQRRAQNLEEPKRVC